MSFKAFRLPHLKFFTQAHESDVRGDAGMLSEPLRDDGASVLVDAEDFAGAEECSRELISLIGIGREVLDKVIDFVDEALTARVERWRIERRIAINAVKAVFGEDSAEGSWD